MNSHDLDPDPELTPEQLKLVEELSETEVKAIDNALLANASEKWRKVARVVGATMMELPCRVEGVPDVFYSQRIKRLAQIGLLESQGNLSHMRYSEIRRVKENET